MARLPVSGATIVSPRRDESDLHCVLSELHFGEACDASAVHELYWKIGAIIGQWLSEQQRMEISPIAKALLSTARNLNEASILLTGTETGFHSDFEIAVASRAAQYLALDPSVGSLAKAQELISTFQQDAARIAHVCMVAFVDLPDGPGERGRPALDWYDDFMALLLDIAEKGGVEPTLRKDRITSARSGWLFEAAQALESFLYPEMRSPTPEACGKRLERSQRRLRDAKRQKPRAR